MIIQSNRLTLKETESTDLEKVQAIWNNGQIMQWVGYPDGLNITLEKLSKWHNFTSNSPNHFHFIVTTKDDQLCGEVFYAKDLDHKRAGLDVKFLGEHQGKGYASEALKALINHIFTNEPDIDAVWTEPSEVNTAARKLYSRCGMTSKQRPLDMEEGDSYWELSRTDWNSVSE